MIRGCVRGSGMNLDNRIQAEDANVLETDSKRWSSISLERGRAPDFLYIGAPRCGSTWLYKALRAHPDIYVPDGKGINFFDSNFDRGPQWYFSHFARAKPVQIVGEVSHDIYAHPQAAARIARVLPKARLILCLREPVDFARSVVHWWHTHTNQFGSTPDEMMSHAHFDALLNYRGNIETLQEYVGYERLKIVFFEDLKRSPASVLRDIFHFLEVEPKFGSDSIERPVNTTRPARFPSLTKGAFRIGAEMRRLGGGRLVERMKTYTLIQTLLYRSAERAARMQLPEDRLVKLRRRLEPDYRHLERLVGRPLPSEWFPTT